MYNDLFSIGPIDIHTYGVMIALGVFFAFLLAEKRLKNQSLDVDSLYGIGLFSLVTGIIGSKVLFCIVEFDTVIKDPISIFTGNGFVVYGGIIGGILGAMIYAKWKKLEFLKYFDIIMPSVALAQGFGRIGCFFAGCCYGRETDSFLGIAFHNSHFAPNGVKLIPTQLISSAGNFLIMILLILYARKNHQPGKVGALYFILYSVGRFFVEFLRNDHRGDVFGVFSTSQFISIFILGIGIALFYFFDKKEKGNEKLKEE